MSKKDSWLSECEIHEKGYPDRAEVMRKGSLGRVDGVTFSAYTREEGSYFAPVDEDTVYFQSINAPLGKRASLPYLLTALLPISTR